MENHEPASNVHLQMMSLSTPSRVESLNSFNILDGSNLETEERVALATENMSPSCSCSTTLMEMGVPLPTKPPTPPLKSVRLLRQLPFRERNGEDGRRMVAPPHITVPPKKAFGYPERYKSPTDAMVSPVSRGLLTRNRRPSSTLAPVVPPKALNNTFQDVC